MKFKEEIKFKNCFFLPNSDYDDFSFLRIAKNQIP